MVTDPVLWPCVEELAEALLRERTLSARALREVYEQSSNRRIATSVACAPLEGELSMPTGGCVPGPS